MPQTTPNDAARPSPAEAKLQMIVARTLWSVENAATEFPDAESRQAAFAKAKQEYKQQARKLLRQLNAKGVELRLTESAET